MLADMDGNLLSLMVMSIHQDPLDQIIAILVACDVDQRDAWTVWVSSGDDSEVSIQELWPTNLETLLHHFRGELVNAIVVRVCKDMINDATLVRRRAMLAQVLDAPVAELAVGDQINICNDLLDGGALLIFDTVLENVLHDKTSSFAQGDLMPHASQSFVDLQHDLWWLATPAQFEQFLPDMTCVTMDDGVRDAAKQFAHHVSLVILRDGIKCLLDDVTTERIHAQRDNISVNGIGNCDDLIWGAMLEAALNKEVAETIDHEGVSLIDNGFDDLELLLCSADLELLLEEDAGLLIIVTDNLVNNILPVAGHGFVKKTTVVHWFEWRYIGLPVHCSGLEIVSKSAWQRREALTGSDQGLPAPCTALVGNSGAAGVIGVASPRW